MDERERLGLSGEQAAAQTELDRLAQAQARGEVDADSLEYKKFSGYDAEQGTVSLTDSRGGVAAVSSQGSLSNAAIAAGDPVSPYGWKVADWSPTIIEPEIIVPRDFSAQPGGGGNGLAFGPGQGDEPGGDGGDGAGDGEGDRCTSQLLCYRGVPYEDPAENEPPQPGQCNEPYGVRWAWVYLSPNGWLLSQDRVSGGYPPFEIYITTPGQPNRFTGNIESRSRAALISHDENGNEVPPNSYHQPGSGRRRKGYPAYYRIGRGNRFNYPQFYPSGPPAGWTQAPGITYSNPVNVDVSKGNDLYVGPNTPPDDCGEFGVPPSAYGPPIGSDPEEWRSICSNNPPINYTAETDSDRTLITATDAAGELAKLDFEPGQYQIKIACKEDGCDTEPNCETQRFWSRTLGEPPDPWQSGPLSFNPPMQTSVTIDDNTGEQVVAIFDASTTATEPLATTTFPDANYETAIRCDGDGAPDS